MSGVIKERRSLDLIIQEICMTCISQGLNATEAMAKYAVSIVTLAPTSESEDTLIFHITESAVNYLMSMKGIKLQLLQAQAYYAENFKNEDYVVNVRRKLLNTYADPLLKHVIIYDRAHPDDAMILRQIVLLTIIMTGMGDPTNTLIYKEAEAAVTSVMSTKDVIKFIHLSQVKKRRQLQEVIKLVTGIRMYNRARSEMPKKGDDQDDIDNLPKLLVSAISSVHEMIQLKIVALSASVINLEGALEGCYGWDLKSANMLNCTKGNILDEEFDFAKNLLTLWHQILIILSYVEVFERSERVGSSTLEIYCFLLWIYLTFRTMLKNISRNLFEQLKSEDEMRSKILVMMDKLNCKVGVPSKEVFPDFLELFQHWKGFQNRLVLVNEYNVMLQNMEEYSNVSNVPLAVLAIIHDDVWPPEEESDVIDRGSSSFQIIAFKDMDEAPSIEFGGFCPVWLILTEGILLTGNKNIGCLKYNGKIYAFRDVKAAKVFTQSPEIFISKVYLFGNHNPEYIDVLQLRNGLKTRGWEMGDWSKSRKAHRDKLIQTEIHPLQEGHDYKYRHSLWDMKKDACQLADLRNSRTHSAQTRLSHWKRWIATQTYDTKKGGSQTMKDSYSNVPKLQNFIYGLRGQYEEVQKVVTLTRPVEEGLTDIVKQEPVIELCRDRACFRYGKCVTFCKRYGCQIGLIQQPGKFVLKEDKNV